MSPAPNRTPGRVAWIDASGGISGDMLLGSCLDAGASLAVVQAAVGSLGLGPHVSISTQTVRRAGFRATHAVVSAAPNQRPRHLREITGLIESSGLPPMVTERSVATFHRLAKAEAQVHGVSPEEVHFHEVGALDSIADVVGTITALAELGIEKVMCGPISLGGGTVETTHGTLAIPCPAVLALLSGSAAATQGGPAAVELATPTGVALALTLADEFSPMPQITVARVGVGAGSRDVPGHANVCRLVIGQPAPTGDPLSPAMTVIETNVDDMDPRLWPVAVEALMKAGAVDAWLTPIVMKKGRPAHTLHVLATPDQVSALCDVIFVHTSSIGLRTYPVDRAVLDREDVTVIVHGQPIRVKVASLRGRIVNAQPEFDDVLAVAKKLDQPPRAILQQAQLLAGEYAV